MMPSLPGGTTLVLRFVFSCLALFSAATVAHALRVLPPRGDQPRSDGMLRDYLREASHAALDRRLERYESHKTPDDIAAYRQELRGRFVEALGGFPERTPLNARTVGQLDGNGFRVEKIIYESQPGFLVTALLYLPESEPPHPVVLMPCGHSQNGKAGYQQPAITLARNGLAVFCFDPIGQGERLQVVREDAADADPKTADSFLPTSEHTVAGVAPILLGRNLATYMIWDGMRGIDYLETRADIDAKRLGCAGNSGGGMMTAYLMALDERIVSAASCCFITTSRRKNESPGPGDAEQNIHAQYAYGMDHPDFLIMRAPQPTLIGSATRDYVPIEGAWEAFRQAKRVYTRLGFAERVDLVETDAPHGFSVQLREGVARWMRRWLLDRHDPVVEQPSPLFSDRELHCTPTGQVLDLDGARSIFDLNREEAARLAPERKKNWSSLSNEERRELVRQIAGIRPPGELPDPQTEQLGVVNRPGYRIQKIIVAPEAGIQLPALHFVPGKPDGRRGFYLHGRGKHIDSEPGGAIERLVRDGMEILAVDLRGFGETAMHPWRTRPAEVAGNNGAEFFVAYMLGRSLVGMRVEDALISAKLLSNLPGNRGSLIELIAHEEAAIPALFAAALEPKLFSNVRLVRAIDSWERVLELDVTQRQLESVVHGALRTCDLPDLAALAGDVTFVEPVDARGRLLAQ